MVNITHRYEELVKRILECRKCGLWKTRKNPVPGEGRIPSEIMIVGEAPGRMEDISGRPFVGRAGNLLTQVLSSIGIDRKDVYITNIVKCRPPGNRTPLANEIMSCIPYLEEQIRIVSPQIILALGRTAARCLADQKLPLRMLPKERKMESLRGKVHYLRIDDRRISVVVTYHPAAVLRNPRLMHNFREDLLLLKKTLSGP
jgi:uracil-DNA glycosylase family 4